MVHIIPKKLHRSLIKTLLQIEKRLRFVISALVLSGSMFVATTFFDSYSVWFLVPIFIGITYLFTYLSLLEGIEKGEWFMLFVIPIMLTLSFYFFSFLFPPLWRYRAPLIFVYGFSAYAILLTSNIFNVGVEKSIQLYRAAFSVNYFYHALISFILTSVILSFKQVFWVNAVLVFIIFFPLVLQLYWSVKPRNEITRVVILYASYTALIISEIAIMFSFISLNAAVLALVLTAAYYCISGLIFHQMEQRLFKQTIREYIIVMSFVVVIVLLSIRW
ncbi:hypothetical protein HGA88_02075 [Candidatus Roizmanbacteria bacterium]|nr:hypothetical protein [Candidatus Roizmanbacteria bacterium]